MARSSDNSDKLLDRPFEHDQLSLDNVRADLLPAKGEQALVGTLERITFANEDNGFLIGRFLAEGQRETITVKGVLGSVREGETLKLLGVWEDHPTYGLQFAVRSALVMEPTTLEGIQRYLAANIEGVGDTLAKRIVKIFGHETFDVIDREPEKLLEVPKFPRKALAAVKEGWQAQKVKREILVFLHSVGISPLFAERIFQTYGIGAVEAVKENPYRLALDIQGIGFRTADLIAAKLGVARDSPQRAEAGALFVLDEAGGEGHTCLPRPRLAERSAALLEVGPALVQQAVDGLLAGGLLKALDVPAESAPAAAERSADEAAAPPAGSPGEPGSTLLFRNRMSRAEQHIAEHLHRIAGSDAFTRFRAIGETVAKMEREAGIYLSEEQRAAVEQALEHKVLVITGGPGTGKTTIIRFILGLVAGQMPGIALAAPTGKAAKRLAEATGRSASTLHRLLEAGPKGFQRNADRPIDAELVIVDESSMIDTLLMEALLMALPDHTRLVLVGDVDQLPSVGPGQVLSDLIGAGRLPVARLETVFRQSERSRITANAHAIRKGELPDLSRPAEGELVDFYFLPESDPARIVDKIRTMLLERIPEAFGFDPRSDVQVLSPMHRGLTGAQNLNRMLQQWLNPKGEEITHGDPPFRVGDRVMQTRNDYDHEVFNGDMGEITGFDPDSGEVAIDFDGREVIFEKRHMEHLTLGYAITVHKSQGSEYPAVVLPLTTHHTIMLQRNLLYTAITRGRRLVVVVGTERAMAMAVHNARPMVRHTGLKLRLQGVDG
ncbi:MAG TPA: ATP-dependent RecD-like DNA helicase [bacterium]|nr:ATP-dependent RecD-like DNA helicase [bacterium]